MNLRLISWNDQERKVSDVWQNKLQAVISTKPFVPMANETFAVTRGKYSTKVGNSAGLQSETLLKKLNILRSIFMLICKSFTQQYDLLCTSKALQSFVLLTLLYDIVFCGTILFSCGHSYSRQEHCPQTWALLLAEWRKLKMEKVLTSEVLTPPTIVRCIVFKNCTGCCQLP